MLSLSCRMECKIKQALKVCGGATQSIFPQVEAWLISSPDHMRALEYVAKKKKMEKYQSVMDFLFCEIFLQYKPACFKFYEGRGPLLKDILNAEQLVFFNKVLLKGVEIAYDLFCQQRRASWHSFRHRVLQLAA